MGAIGIIANFSKLKDVSFVRTDLTPPQQDDVPTWETSASKLFMGPQQGTGGGGGSFSLGVSTGGNTAGQTGVTGTRIVLAGGGEITLSQVTGPAGATITVSAPPQSVQTQNRFNLTAAGNTAGALQEISSGTLTLAGGNRITLSQAGNAITISGADQSVQPETQTFLGGVANSETTYTSGTVRLSELGAVTIRSTTGQQLQISVAPQSVQPETQTFVGGLAGSDTIYTSGTVRISGVGGGVTVSSNTGQRIDISVAAPVAQTGTQFSAGISGGNTAGDTGTVAGRLVLAGGANITLSGSVNGASETITIVGPATQPSFSAGVSTLGNSAGDTGVTGTRLVLVGGQSITLSQATNANGGTITISGASTSQSVQTQDRFNLTLSGNTAGVLAQVSSGTLTLAGGNNITVSQAGNAITISGANVGGAQTGISGIANSETTYTSGTVTLSELGAITIRSTTGNQFQLSVNPQSNQTLGLFALGNTVGESSSTTRDARSVSLRGDGIVSLGYSNGSLRISASQSVQPETQTFIGGISASDTVYTSGTVRFTGVGGGITVSSNTGQRVDLSVAAPVNFSAGVSNLGNTAGDTGVSGTRMVLAGLGEITLSQATNANGNTVSISAPAQTQESQSIGMSNVGNTSGDTGMASGAQVRFVLAGGNNITLSQSLNGASGTITISGPNTAAQSNQTLGMYALGNTTGQSSSTTMDARTLSIQGDGIVSVGYSNGSLRISASQSVQPETQTFLGGLVASDKTYTSGTITITGVGGGITVNSNAGQRIDLSVAAPVAQTDQTLGLYAVQNTTGQSSSTTRDARSLSFAGDGAVSIGFSAGSLRISAPTQTGTQFSAGLTNAGNTAGDTGTVAGRLVLVGTNNITLSGSTNGASQTVSIVGPNTNPSFSAGASNLGNTAGDTGVTGTRMVLVGSDNITISQATGAAGATVSLIGPAAGAFSAGVSNIGNTAGDTGVTGTRLVLAGGNNVTVSQATNANGGTVTISAFDQSNQTLGLYAVGNTTGQSSSTTRDARSISVDGAGAASVGYSAGSLRISVPVQTVESQSIGMSNLGNTAGDTGMASGGQVRFVIVGSQNISLSQSLNGASGTISISGNPAFSAGASNLGNTAGDTGVSGTRLVLVGTNNVTLSQATGAAGATISISAAGGGAGQFSAGASNLGNTAGSTGVTGTRLVLVGTNNISVSQSTDGNGGTVSFNNTVSAFQAGVSTEGNTAGDTGVTGTRLVLVGSSPLSLSQATGANGGTVTINAPQTSSLVGVSGISVSTNGSTISVFRSVQTQFYPFNDIPIVTGQQGQATLHLAPVDFPNVQHDRVLLGFQFSNASNSSGSITLSAWLGLYSRNASSISLISSTSGSTNFSGSGTVGSYSLYAGPRWFTIPWANTVTEDHYWFGILTRTTTGGAAGHSLSQLCVSKFTNSAWSGILGAGSTATNQYQLGLGVYSASTSGIPGSIAFSEIQGSGSMALREPIFHLRSGTV